MKALNRIICFLFMLSLLMGATACKGGSSVENSSEEDIIGAETSVEEGLESSEEQSESGSAEENVKPENPSGNQTNKPSNSAPEVGEPTTPPVNDNKSYIDGSIFKTKDINGQYTINILGDSISHGANAPNIPRDSYMGVFKQSVAAAWKGANNYGFVSLLAVLDNKSGVYREMHSVSQSGDWEIDQSGEYLGAYAFKTSTPGADITINPTQSYKYTAIFYDQQPNGGDFDVVIGGNVVKTISTKGARNTSARTALIANANGGTERIQIITKNSKNVTITGVGYYNTTDGVVVNNYSRGGLQLTQISDDVIIKACKSSVVVIALGHNDMFFDTGAQFTQKINLIISEIKKNGSKLIVNDFTWGNPQGVNIKKELQRLATTCGGTFNDLTFAMRNDIQDGSHPTVRGHAILAKKLCENLKISCVK